MHGFPLINSPIPLVFVPFILILIVWELIIKGYALWYSARGHQKVWFIVFLVLHTAGILEVIYLIWFRRRTPVAGESAPIISSSAQ
jgi:hypothetical protein